MSHAWRGLQRNYLTFDEVIALGTKTRETLALYGLQRWHGGSVK